MGFNHALLNLLTGCLYPSCGHAAHDCLLSLTLILSKPITQELTSIFIHSFPSLVNSGTLSLHLYFLLPTTYTLSRGEFQDTYPNVLDLFGPVSLKGVAI